MLNVAELLDCVKKEERASLTEAESKILLSAYGIPVVEEAIVTEEDDAASQAQKIGFPVVLKGHGARLTHKTERGLVKVNLRSDFEVIQAYRQIKEAAGEDWEGCLIQPLVEGKREFAAGLVRDPQFGPTVMFGLGGVFTEALGDATFRIAPFSETQAEVMLDEIKSSKLLGAFRGEEKADRDALKQTLLGLARLGLEHPEIKEVDINPLIVTPDGKVKAVDALVVLGENADAPIGPALSEEEQEQWIQETRQALHRAFNAESVAVVGATKPNISGFAGMFGCMHLFGFKGRLYPINPKLDEIYGHKAYPNLTALPEKVDLVIVSVPARVVPGVLRECVATGNKAVHIFTAGFKESGEEEGVRLQKEMKQIAVEGGLRVIGPNCMGFYVPNRRMLTWQMASKKSGPIALISQSGGNAQEITHYATGRYGIGFNKVVSYGNALTVESADFLDYLAGDDETEIITMYLEGLKNGRRFLKLAEKTNKKKPILIYKGGLSETGAQAVSSHTGALAGGPKIWHSFFRQTGCVLMESVEELAEVAMAFHYLPETKGPRTAVLGYGGGAGVSVADNCAKLNLALPDFSEDLLGKLREIIPPAGTIIRNPIDAMIAYFDFDVMGKIFKLMAESDEIDNVLMSIPLDWLFNKEEGGGYIETLTRYVAEEGVKHLGGKPFIATWRQYMPSEKIRSWAPVMEKILLDAGIPVYEGMARGINAMAKVTAYYDFHAKNK
ncbi:acetate--CoA ligase family protein [Desulfatibacillum aliphaticivorans]|uniref:acetate--CoA ligase family protein n=1 Tax=Desulfatibacillum aliphaticivorans TaxID=218208 RepID=UPI000420A410|nr:acetate--CoA ligase family protein [Desulfatibacillum aliphaticivorans]